MKTIRIINGTYGHRPEGSQFVVPVSASDPPISVSDERAERLVQAKVAMYVDAKDVIPDVATALTGGEGKGQGNNGEQGEGTGNGSGETNSNALYSVAMKADDLREVMKNHNLTVKVGMTKAEMVELLNEAEAAKKEANKNDAEHGDDDEVNGADEEAKTDNEDPPNVTASELVE